MYIGFVHAIVCTTFAKILPCVSIAPFGVPVVPPVYCRTAGSSAEILEDPPAADQPGARRSEKASVPSMDGGGVPAAAYSAIDVTMICSIVVWVRRFCAIGASASSVISTLGVESVATTRNSRGV